MPKLFQHLGEKGSKPASTAQGLGGDLPQRGAGAVDAAAEGIRQRAGQAAVMLIDAGIVVRIGSFKEMK